MRSLTRIHLIGYGSLLLIGWGGLVVPSLIRSVKESFGRTDADIGLYYFLTAAAWAIGTIVASVLTERAGRRWVLTAGVALHGAGIAALGLVPDWSLFLLAGLPVGFGAGVIDSGVNALFLERFAEGRGRAITILHLFFSIGALAAPIAIGTLVGTGVPWETIALATGLAAIPVVILSATAPMPSGRRTIGRGGEGAALAGTGVATSRESVVGRLAVRARSSVAGRLALLGVAIAAYVASEVGVSNWVVRFLEPAPLATATLALTLYWIGVTAGRLVISRIADRFDHRHLAAACAAGMAGAIVAASLVPSLQASIACFALAGAFSGPIFPLIVVIGGERIPDRLPAVSGFLTGIAVAGSISYPPFMGFLSVTVGILPAMLGNAVLAAVCVVALLVTTSTAARRKSPAA